VRPFDGRSVNGRDRLGIRDACRDNREAEKKDSVDAWSDETAYIYIYICVCVCVRVKYV